MENFWRVNSNWQHIGASPNVQPPQLPPRPTMRVRAVGRSFCVDGRVVPVGEFAVLDVDDARRLIDAGKAEYVA